MTSIQSVFIPTYRKTAKVMPSLTASHVVIPSILAVYLSRQDGAIYRPSRHSWMLDWLKKEASIELLAIVHT